RGGHHPPPPRHRRDHLRRFDRRAAGAYPSGLFAANFAWLACATYIDRLLRYGNWRLYTARGGLGDWSSLVNSTGSCDMKSLNSFRSTASRKVSSTASTPVIVSVLVSPVRLLTRRIRSSRSNRSGPLLFHRTESASSSGSCRIRCPTSPELTRIAKTSSTARVRSAASPFESMARSATSR